MTNKEIVKAWFANVDSENYDEIKKLMDEKYSFRNPMIPAPLGIKEHIDIMDMFSSAFSGVKHQLTHFVNEGEWISVYGTMGGKHTGDFNGVSATDIDILITWMQMFHIVNEKVVDAFIELNPLNIMTQIGTDIPS